ncbi:hypothetical protein [Mycobacterium sp. 23]|uniref:hypothetical protein n=1 Tax=Mycobacterium sp. 23 TaxID=3400424 RepID=UPI003AAD37D0
MSENTLQWDIPDDPYHNDPLIPCYSDTPSLGNSEIGKTLFGSLNDMASTPMAGQITKTVPLEHILKFFDGYNALAPAADDVAPGHHDAWNRIAEALRTAEQQLRDAIALARGTLSGATVSAILQKASDSTNYLTSLADATRRMDPLVDTFSRDVKETRDWFEAMNTKLNTDLANMMGENSLGDYSIDQKRLDDLMAIYDNMARTTIQDFYNPPIEWVSQRHPDMSAGPPRVPGAPGGGPGSPSFGDSPPGRLRPGGLGLPDMPSLQPAGRTDPSAAQPNAPTMPTNAMQGLGDAAKGAGDAANDATQKAQNAAGQAGNAANQALGQIPQGGKDGHAALPEGVLGLGPSGLKGASAAPGSGGGRGGGTGGTASRTPTVGKPSAQLASAGNTASSAPVSRAGAGAGAGASGAGAPVAGHRGGAGADKQHKVSKALRHARHGQDVIGEAEAVLPVVGDESDGPSKPPRSTAEPQ